MNWSRIALIALLVVIAIVIKVSIRRKSVSPPIPVKTYFKEGSHPTASDVLAKYRELGYAAAADALKAKTRPCVHLVADPSAGKPLGSRLGGRPDLPDTGQWPKYKGKSMAFLAQLNLNEIAAGARPSTLPAAGMLYFFYDAEQSTWGFDPKDKGSWAVLYRESTSEAAPPADYPSDLPKEARYRSVPVKLAPDESIPDPAEILSALSLSEAQEDEIGEVYGQYSEQSSPCHQLLGYPQAIQDNEMELDCQLASHGLYVGDGKGYKDPRVKTLRAGARNWRLLLQIDSDDAAEMMWGDAGMLYFWITESDLKERRFENVWMISQCY